MSKLVRTVAQTIRAKKLFSAGQSILVAVSGGLDSMVLLHLLHRLSSRNRWKLTVAHFNHQLRGAGSDADEELVRETAARFRLPFESERWNDPNSCDRVKEHGLEMAARLARHDFLGRAAKQWKMPAVAMAHHAGDQVELFFLRLFRGAGGEGLGGMKWLNRLMSHPDVKLVRPLLAETKAALQAYAAEENITFSEDATNASSDFERNRIRHELLPLLRERFGSSVEKTILRTMDIVGTEAEYVRQHAERWLKRHRSAGFDELHPALQRQCLRIQLQKLQGSAEFEWVEQLRGFPLKPLSANATYSVYREGAELVRRQKAVRSGFNPNETLLNLTTEHEEQTFGGLKIQWWREKAAERFRKTAKSLGCEFFDEAKVGSRVRLRYWRKGDRFQPIGMARKVKLQDLFTNLKIPRDRRRDLVVAATAGGDRIFWVEGLRISERFKLDKQTRNRLKWQWQRL